MLLKITQELKLNGRTISPGEHISTRNPEQFLQRGLARHLTREETREILDEYVQYAKGVFSEKNRHPTSTIKQGQGLLFATGN